jgi:hypothetical protein
MPLLQALSFPSSISKNDTTPSVRNPSHRRFASGGISQSEWWFSTKLLFTMALIPARDVHAVVQGEGAPQEVKVWIEIP